MPIPGLDDDDIYIPNRKPEPTITTKPELPSEEVEEAVDADVNKDLQAEKREIQNSIKNSYFRDTKIVKINKNVIPKDYPAVAFDPKKYK